MSDNSSPDVANDEDFFDEPTSSRRSANVTTAAAERRRSSSVSSDASSTTERSRRRGSSDEANSDHSSEAERRHSDEEEEPRGRRTSSSNVKNAVVIPLPSDVSDDDQQNDSKKAKGRLRPTGRKKPVQEQPSRHKKKQRAGERKAETVGRDSGNYSNRSSSRSSMSPHQKSGQSSDEEKRRLETARHSRRPVSSASEGQQHGKYRFLRALSAPVRRPQQSRPMTGFNDGSRMDVKMLLESLLQAENAQSRRKPAADTIEFRSKRNYTFNDQRLEMIERENKRLLDKIVTIHYSHPSYSRVSQKRAAPLKPTTAFPDVTRVKQLEKIQKENLVRQQSYIINVLDLNFLSLMV